jgi:hypothetical protein
MLEIKIHRDKMKAQNKVWDGKKWVKQETFFKRRLKEKKNNEKR